MQCFRRNWQDMASRSWRNYLGIYGATETGVASQTSNNRNIPFNGKRNIWLWYFGDKAVVVQCDGFGKGWDQGPLEHEKEICSSLSPTRCSRTKTATKTRKTAKKRKLRKPGCHSTRALAIRDSNVSKWCLRASKGLGRKRKKVVQNNYLLKFHTWSPLDSYLDSSPDH